MPSRKKQKTTQLIDSPAMAAEGASEPLSGFTEELPSLPFMHKYKNGKYYYVRKCYEEYYQVVKEMLNAGKKF
ncbi:hypothetical protein PHYPSEUDO_002772, partial [Phytophthora pseudosyringae]